MEIFYCNMLRLKAELSEMWGFITNKDSVFLCAEGNCGNFSVMTKDPRG